MDYTHYTLVAIVFIIFAVSFILEKTHKKLLKEKDTHIRILKNTISKQEKALDTSAEFFNKIQNAKKVELGIKLMADGKGELIATDKDPAKRAEFQALIDHMKRIIREIKDKKELERLLN